MSEKIRKRKFKVGGREKTFQSFEGDTWKSKKDAEWAADFVRRFPKQNEAIVRKEGSKYRLWFREKRRRRR